MKCVSLNKRSCQTRPRLVNINSNKPFYYPFTVKVEDRVCVPDKVKNMNVKLFDLSQG